MQSYNNNLLNWVDIKNKILRHEITKWKCLPSYIVMLINHSWVNRLDQGEINIKKSVNTFRLVIDRVICLVVEVFWILWREQIFAIFRIELSRHLNTFVCCVSYYRISCFYFVGWKADKIFFQIILLDIIFLELIF